MKTGKLTAFQNTGARSEVPGSDSTYIKEYWTTNKKNVTHIYQISTGKIKKNKYNNATIGTWNSRMKTLIWNLASEILDETI